MGVLSEVDHIGTYGARVECLQVAIQESFWDIWSHSSAQLFLPKQGTLAEDSVQVTKI